MRVLTPKVLLQKLSAATAQQTGKNYFMPLPPTLALRGRERAGKTRWVKAIFANTLIPCPFYLFLAKRRGKEQAAVLAHAIGSTFQVQGGVGPEMAIIDLAIIPHCLYDPDDPAGFEGEGLLRQAIGG
jgi:hypothetical protein